jgi:hypothetical protein
MSEEKDEKPEETKEEKFESLGYEDTKKNPVVPVNQTISIKNRKQIVRRRGR